MVRPPEESEDGAVTVVAEAMREQGAAYPKAGARLILAALRAAGYAVVALPPPVRPGVWSVIHDGEPEDVYIGRKGGVTLSGVETFDERDVPGIAAALLAAAVEAEK